MGEVTTSSAVSKTGVGLGVVRETIEARRERCAGDGWISPREGWEGTVRCVDTNHWYSYIGRGHVEIRPESKGIQSFDGQTKYGNDHTGVLWLLSETRFVTGSRVGAVLGLVVREQFVSQI